MIAHNAQGVELKRILVLTLADSIQKDFPAFKPSQPKFPIIAPHRNVVAKSNF
jgi:hypothetical protein